MRRSAAHSATAPIASACPVQPITTGSGNSYRRSARRPPPVTSRTIASPPAFITPRSKPPEKRSGRPSRTSARASRSAASSAAPSASSIANENALALPSSMRTTARPSRISLVRGAGTARSAPRKAAARLRALEQRREALAAADAHGDDPVAPARALELAEQQAREPRAGHAVGMADRDRAAARVELLVRDPELALAVEELRGEGLVQLDDVDVVHREAVALEQ